MESSYMKIYKNILFKQNKTKYNKSRQKIKKPRIKKNKSLTYYHYDGQINYINKFQMNNDLNNTKYKIGNNTNNNTNMNQNNSFYSYYGGYEYNDTLLLKAYKKSVSDLFKSLKLFMNNELYKYDKIKREFLHNIQKYYNDEKNKEKNLSRNRNKTPNNNIKSYSKQKIKERGMKQNEEMNYSKLHKFNSSNYFTSLPKHINKNSNNNNTSDMLINAYKYSNSRKSNQLKEFLINNKTNNYKSINTSNISGTSLLQNQYTNNYNYNYNNNFDSHNKHQSLFTLFKAENNKLENSPTKKEMDYKNDNIMKKFIKFSKSFISNKNSLNKTCSQTIIKTNRFMLNNNQKNIDIDDCKVSDTITKNNELITRIKDSVDDNLKHIFNFSYENFLNKESERDCN